MGSHTTEEQLTVGLSLGTGVWADGYVVLLGLGELRVTGVEGWGGNVMGCMLGWGLAQGWR